MRAGAKPFLLKRFMKFESGCAESISKEGGYSGKPTGLLHFSGGPKPFEDRVFDRRAVGRRRRNGRASRGPGHRGRG